MKLILCTTALPCVAQSSAVGRFSSGMIACSYKAVASHHCHQHFRLVTTGKRGLEYAYRMRKHRSLLAGTKASVSLVQAL